MDAQLAGLLIIWASLLCTGQSWAGSWQQAMSARASGEYDTNPAMDPAYQGGIWRSLLDPGYTLTGTADANVLQTGLALHVARSSNKTLSQDRDDPSAFINWRHQGEKSELTVSSRYAEASTRITEIQGTGLVAVDGTRASRTLSASWNKALSEHSTLDADGAYTDISYRGGTFIDYATRSGGLKLSYALNENSTAFLRVSSETYMPIGGGATSHLAAATMGLNWKAELVDLTMQAGKSRRGGGNIDTQGGIAAQFTGQRTQLALNADRQVVSSGLGDYVKTDQVNGKWSYELSEFSIVGIDIGWRKNYYSTSNFIRTGGAWLQRELNSSWGMRLYYQRKISGGDAVYSASSNILGFTISYTNPDF